MKNIEVLNKLNQEEKKEILKVWESSVFNTHDFLRAKHFLDMKVSLNKALDTIEGLVVYRDNKKILAFTYLNNKNIEMLFVDFDEINKGIGKKLLNFNLKNGAQTVGVNEENINALSFYLKMGFKVISRSEFDDKGRDYPILHLKI